MMQSVVKKPSVLRIRMLKAFKSISDINLKKVLLN